MSPLSQLLSGLTKAPPPVNIYVWGTGETEGYTWGLLAGSIIETYFNTAVEPKYLIIGEQAQRHRSVQCNIC